MADEIKKMSVTEFVDAGYLQEVNRLWFHERGLALAVSTVTDDNWEQWLDDATDTFITHVVGIETSARPQIRESIEGLARTLGLGPDRKWLGYIWDCRDDPEGVRFGPGVLSREKAEGVARDRQQRVGKRHDHLGYVVQPIPEAE